MDLTTGAATLTRPGGRFRRFAAAALVVVAAGVRVSQRRTLKLAEEAQRYSLGGQGSPKSTRLFASAGRLIAVKAHVGLYSTGDWRSGAGACSGCADARNENVV